MATLQKIRTRAGLLVAIVIGISLAAFILGDMFQSGSSIFRSNQMEIGEIDGESIQYQQFQRQTEQLGDIYKMNNQQNQLDENMWVQVREQTWQNMVHEIVMSDVYNDLGLDVSSEELFDMLQGTNLHPIVQQLFRNPNTGQVDRAAVVRFLKSLESGNVAPEQRSYWYYLEDQIVDERIQTKYNNLVAKGLYVTSNEAQNSMQARSTQVNFDYIPLSYNSVADSQVVVNETDLRNYYDNHKEDYDQEKQRRIEYVTFQVNPSNQDFQDAEKWINDIASDFASTKEDIQFVDSNSDESFDDTWYKKEDLPENIQNWVFEEGANVGDIFGPYFENDAYKLAKLHASEMLPDSVEARHILLRVNSQAEMAAQQQLADSLKTAIENGSNFEELAREYSTDQGSAVQGGDLGWFGRGQMVKPFEEAAFNNKKGEVTVVQSQFGLHIIQTTDKGKQSPHVQIAYLVRNVVPSTKTYQDVYAQASKFASENTNKEEFDAAVAEQQLNKKVASVGENDRNIAGLENARSLIKAAYDTEQGEMIQDQQGSTIFELGDNFVIATVASITNEGIADFESVKDRVELAVLREKKAEFLKEKARAAIEGKSDLQVVASELNATVKNANGVNLNSLQVPGMGIEPAVIGTLSSLDVDKISEPVEGNSAVYVLEITSKNEVPAGDLNTEQTRMAQNLNFRATSQAYEAHKNAVEISDKRSKFY